MWIMLTDSFLSIVEHPVRRKLLLVRARAEGDIERVFPTARVTHTPHKDYAYRASLHRKTVGRALYKQAQEIDYPNFKAAVPDHARHDAYATVWSVMLQWAQGRFRRRMPWGEWPEEPFERIPLPDETP